MAAYLYVHPQGHVMDRVEQSSCISSVTIAGFPVLDSVIGDGILNASV